MYIYVQTGIYKGRRIYKQAQVQVGVYTSGYIYKRVQLNDTKYKPEAIIEGEDYFVVDAIVES